MIRQTYRSITARLAGAVCATLTLVGCIALPAWAEPVRIGFSRPVTGLFSRIAEPQFDAYELWRERVNAAGGLDIGGKTRRPVAFVWRDDRSDPVIAAKIYEELIVDDKVDLLLAPWGTVHLLAVSGVIERHKFPMIANSVRTAVLDRLEPKNIWFPSPDRPQRVAAAVAAFLKARNARSIALITNASPFCREARGFLIRELEKRSLSPAFDAVFPAYTDDLTNVLSSIPASEHDAVLVYGFSGDTALYVKAAEALNLKPRILIALAAPSGTAFTSQPGAAGLITPGHWTPDKRDWPRARPFAKAFREKYEKPSDVSVAPQAYASAEILGQAVARAGLKKLALGKVLNSASFETVYGPVRFKNQFNIVTPAMLLQRQGETARIVWPEDQATEGREGRKSSKDSAPR